MSIPLVGSPPPAAKPDITDLLTGPSSSFKGGIGNWTASGTGTTIAYDGAVGIDASHGSAKLHCTTNSNTRYGVISLPGTFKANRLYHVSLLVWHDTIGSAEIVAYDTSFGDQGSGDVTGYTQWFKHQTATITGGLPSGRWVLLGVTWMPTSDRTSVTLRFGRSNAAYSANPYDIWMGKVRVAEAIPGTPGLATQSVAYGDTSGVRGLIEMRAVGADTGVGIPVKSSGSHFIGVKFGLQGAELRGPEDLDGNWPYMAMNTGVVAYSRQDSIGRRSANWNEEYGEDYVGLYKGERSDSEIDIFPDWNIDMFLLDGHNDADTTHHWYHEEADGSYKLDGHGALAGRKSRIGLYFQREFHVTGGQTTGNAKNEPAEYFQLPFPAEIDEVRAHLGTAPTGSTFIVDVNINGTTIFTTQANRPTVAISGTDATSGAPDTTKYAKNDRLSFDTDQVGSTIPGSDLTVMVRGRYLW